MIKICITVRNRLAITKKCIQALQKHSRLPHEIYIYDSRTNYKINDHISYFGDLYKKGIIKQFIFLSEESTFNCFDKAVASNLFFLQHNQDPNKDKYDFLLLLDNDIIVSHKYDSVLKQGWDYIKKHNLGDLKVLGQSPGGVKNKTKVGILKSGIQLNHGFLGGSGLWSVKPNFYKEVGLLDLTKLVGKHKCHDQNYWQKFAKITNGKPYIGALEVKLGIHCGKLCGSVANCLTKIKDKKQALEKIKFKESDEKIDKMGFDDFYKMIKNDKDLLNDW